MEKQPTMMDYIYQTPATVVANLERSKALTKQMVDLFLAKAHKSICIVASGSSYNGSLCARDFIRKYLKTEVKLVPPFTFVNHEHDLRDDSFTVVVSQSGCSTNAIECLKLLREQNETTIGLTGRDECDFLPYCDHLINWGVGEEKVGYVTKGVVTLATFWMLFALEASLKLQRITTEQYQEAKDDIKKAMMIHKELTQETINKYHDNYKVFTSMDKLHILASGPNIGTAIEGALKITETVCIPCLACEAEEFIHGPNNQFDPSNAVIFIDNGSHDKSSERIINIFKAVRIITDKAFIITNDPSVDDQLAFRTKEETDPLVSSLYKLTVFETLAYLITEDTVRWHKHPLFLKFKNNDLVKSKSRENLYNTL
ncbi:MAG: SIS domain-containing protein [Erysipelotrichaceae bacterium]|nr:SIS domain-containing protein [Erysipelotrichaceae bacterium]